LSPRAKRGVPWHLCASGGHGWDAVPIEVRDASLSLGRTRWGGYDKVVAYDRGVPLDFSLDFSFFSRNIIPMFAKLQNLTFAKKCRKIIKKKERIMLFGNISDFCLKIAFEKA